MAVRDHLDIIAIELAADLSGREGGRTDHSSGTAYGASRERR
jgi:hypothetical protein